MFKKLLNKIKSLFSKKQITEQVPEEKHKEVHTNITTERIADNAVTTKSYPKCNHCGKELTEDKVSSTDEDGVNYIWCTGCNYVNKLKDGVIIDKPNTVDEVMKALKLFKASSIQVSQYAMTENGERRTIRK